jgi:hypothetical protein
LRSELSRSFNVTITEPGGGTNIEPSRPLEAVVGLFLRF